MEPTAASSSSAGSEDRFRATEKAIKECINAAKQDNKNNRKRIGEKRKADAEAVRHAHGSDDGSLFAISEVINIHNYEAYGDPRIIPCYANNSCRRTFSELEFNVQPTARIFSFDGTAPGFFVIRNALSVESQIYWGTTALATYSKSVHTNLTNLSGEYAARVQSKEPPGSEEDGATAEDSSDLWSVSVSESNNFAKFKKLRWANLGYHYNWTLRKYVQNEKSQFPVDFAILCQQAADLVGLEINPEAGIVNYYPMGTQMCGHIDDAEHCMEEPIVSFSVGCTCIFLIGGTSKDEKPTPLLLRSGDCVVMSGQSRYCYHGVPVILSKDQEFVHFEPHSCRGSVIDSLITDTVGTVSSNVVIDASSRKALDYLSNARVNFNARRVTHKEGVWIDKNGSGYETKT
jgi:alkylated DNA repair protein alkB family protein 1